MQRSCSKQGTGNAPSLFSPFNPLLPLCLGPLPHRQDPLVWISPDVRPKIQKNQPEEWAAKRGISMSGGGTHQHRSTKGSSSSRFSPWQERLPVCPPRTLQMKTCLRCLGTWPPGGDLLCCLPGNDEARVFLPTGVSGSLTASFLTRRDPNATRPMQPGSLMTLSFFMMVV